MSSALETAGLRQRLGGHADSTASVSVDDDQIDITDGADVADVADVADMADILDGNKPKKTYGRTPDGTGKISARLTWLHLAL